MTNHYSSVCAKWCFVTLKFESKLTEMQDRERIASVLMANEALIVRRVRAKLRAAGVRGFGVHPEDIFASVVRRIDGTLAAGLLRTHCDREFWGFVHTTTDNLVAARLRTQQREQAALSRWVERHLAGKSDGQSTEEQLLAQVILVLRDDFDLQLLRWRLKGLAYAQIASITSISEVALRRRYARMLQKLRRSLQLQGSEANSNSKPGGSALEEN